MMTTSFEKGMEQGQRTLLESQLEQRFGPLSEEAKRRLAAWPSAKLTELGRTLLTASSLRELGLEG
jgi:hypothetical protein